MKKLFISLVLCLIAEFVMSQTIICNGSNAVFSGDSRPGAYLWTVESPNGAIIFNGSVATIIDGFPLPPFGVPVNSANNVRIRFDAGGRFRVRVRRFTSGIQRFERIFLVDVPNPEPKFSFTAPLPNCGARFTLNGAQFPNTTLQWFRVNNNGVSIAIPGATGTSVDVAPLFEPLVLVSTYTNFIAPSGCQVVTAPSTGIPPAGLGNITLSDGGIGSTVCTSPATVFTATASLCNAIANGWSWTASGQVQLLSTTNSGTTSTVTFRLLSATGGGFANISVSNNSQTAELNYDVLSWPNCDFLLRKPTDPKGPQLEALRSDKMDKVGEITENTEGVKDNISIGGNSNNATTKKAIYPNPANDFLTVEDIGGVEKIQIIDLTGKVIRNVDIEQDEIGRTLNISDLTNGMYILKMIKKDGQLEAAKFQVMH